MSQILLLDDDKGSVDLNFTARPLTTGAPVLRINCWFCLNLVLFLLMFASIVSIVWRMNVCMSDQTLPLIVFTITQLIPSLADSQKSKEIQDLQKIVAEVDSRVSIHDIEVEDSKDRHNSHQSRSDAIERRLTETQANYTAMLSTLRERYNDLQQRVQQNGNRLNETIDTLKDLRTVFKQLINWKAESDGKVNTALAMTQQIHELLYNRSLEERLKSTTGARVESQRVESNSYHNLVESRVQSMATNGAFTPNMSYLLCLIIACKLCFA